ncbi:MAG TPA: gamma-glutamylcyclotransferase family protein [Terriglobales bacterium]|nr:gamma-glutamylcyclotransferase family protein [Terriglobales bacterium]
MNRSTNGRPRSKRYLFFYGTLIPRFAPAEIESTVRQLRRVGRGSVRGKLFDLGEYPGAVLSSTGGPIKGLVFELPDDPKVLDRLDEYEGFDPEKPGSSLFVRKRRQAELEDGRKLACWVYAYNRPVKAETAVSGGDYLRRRTRRRSTPARPH